MTGGLTQRELRNQSGEITRALDRGEDFVVTRNGVPVGELRPIGRRDFATRNAVVRAFSGAPAINYEQFRADFDAFWRSSFLPCLWRSWPRDRRRPRLRGLGALVELVDLG
jgi:antitoxin (DNA-binding transcriptional repressor) of toxin-antitoxin stability system